MLSQYVLSLEGMAAYQTAAFLLFFGVFCGVVVWALRLRTPFVDRMASMPLDDSDRTPEVHP